MSTPAASPEGATEAPESQEAPQGPDFSPVLDRMDQIDARFDRFDEWVQSQSAPPEQEESYEDYVNRLFSGEEPAEAERPEQGPEIPAFVRDPQMFQQLLDRAVEERVGSRLDAIDRRELQRDADDLVSRYPALENVETQREIVLAAQQFAQEIGQPEAWRSPRVIELMYLAEQARGQSDAEVPPDASGGEATLERGGGGNPGSPEVGLADQIIQGYHGGRQGSIFR